MTAPAGRRSGSRVEPGAPENGLSRRLRILNAAAGDVRLSAADPVDGLLRRVSAGAREIIGAHRAMASLVPDGDWRQAIHGGSTSDEDAGERPVRAIPDTEALRRRVCESNRTLRLPQAELEADPSGRGGIHGWLAAPLTNPDGRNVGLIEVSGKVDGEFTAADEAVLVQLAHIASVVIEIGRLGRALEEAARQRDDFLITLSHELRAPLSAILGWARVLRSAHPDRDTMDRALASIERNARAQAKLLDDLLGNPSRPGPPPC
jgi:GAF domain-containing protein